MPETIPGAWILMYAVLPLWIAAGLADWVCHRATRIEGTSGLKESLLHWLLFAQVGMGMLAVALLEINGAVVLIVLATFAVHEVTVWLELRFVVSRREVRPIEQMLHSFMEILPLASLALLAALSWERLGDFSLRWTNDPLPPGYMAGVAAAVLLFNVVPLAEETWRCWTGRHRHDSGDGGTAREGRFGSPPARG